MNNRVRPQAVVRTLRDAEIDRKRRGGSMLWPLLSEHSTALPFGWINTARIAEDGLVVRGYLDVMTPECQRAFNDARDGKSTGLSLGFRVVAEHQENGVRVIDELEIYEVSVGADPVDDKARFSVGSFSELEYATMRAIRAEQRQFMSDDARKLADIRARLLEDCDEELKRSDMMGNHQWIDDDGDYVRPLQGGSHGDYSPYGEPEKTYHIEYGRPEESRAEFEKELRKTLREDDPDLHNLVPGGKAFNAEIARRQAVREEKQRLQREALEADRRERAERQAAMSRESFTPAQFAEAQGLDLQFVRRWFTHIARTEGVTPVNADGPVLRAQDVKNAAKRDAELLETQAISMRCKRLQERAA